MKNCLISLLFFVSFAQAAETTHLLTAESWAVPRDGDALRNMPTLRTVMQAMQQTDGSRLIIQYPGGDEGTLWAHELRAWLVSLGLESARIELVPGGGHGKALAITVLDGAKPARIPPVSPDSNTQNEAGVVKHAAQVTP